MAVDLESLRSFLSQQKERHLYRVLRPIEGRRGAWVQRGGRWLLNASSNDYLGLSLDPRLSEAALSAVNEFGFGSGASRLITGNTSLHEELEAIIAQWKGSESALLFNSGYHANIGTITALVGEGDLIYSDALNHASIIDGCRLSRARIKVYNHCDMDHLEHLLLEDKGKSGRKLIVTETIFSMDGDEAPLKELVELGDRYNAWVMIDEAHAAGVFGPKGEGLAAEYGIPSEAFIASVGTLGKAVGTFGAYVTGSRILQEYLVNRARSFIFTTALPVPVVAASLRGISLVQELKDLRLSLRKRAEDLRRELREHGFSFPQGRSPIIPWIIGEETHTLYASDLLYERGVLGVAIRPPTVPVGSARIRLTLSAAFTPDDFAFLKKTLVEVGGLLV